ncbi:TIGR03809 family protein [Bradyrhizobium sp. SYSU BS000235]|uniref:TIGR03809 family protein n=1 Tax=Bradyrhizobium sp. SYSU BS000235 TaxID=3411332 RepID=UPI003C76BFA2
MTKLSTADSGRSVVVRWRMLAERRLKYLIELYESGRWKLYYNEPEFLKIVREAHAALKAWETLAPPETARDRPVEVEVAQSVERPAVDLRPENAPSPAAPSLASPPFTRPSFTQPSFSQPSLAMQALRSSTYGVGT